MSTGFSIQKDADMQFSDSKCEESDVTDTPQTMMDTVVREDVSDVSETADEGGLQPNNFDTTLSEATELQDEGHKEEILKQVGQLTRNFHDSLRVLGYDQVFEPLVSEVPDARNKLNYIAAKSKHAAERTLNATEIAMPIQDQLSRDAIQLAEKWKSTFEEQSIQPDTEKFKLLLIETLNYIDQVPEQADTTNVQLMEIMMAQDFQDLTGQVISKVSTLIQTLEDDLVHLLLVNCPHIRKPVPTEEELMNGPVTNFDEVENVVSNQDEADDLLASLGF